MKSCFLLLMGISIGITGSCMAREGNQESNDYKVWKENREKSWQKENVITFRAKLSSLLGSIERSLNMLKKSPNTRIKEEMLFYDKMKQTALYYYNFLRELESLPPIKKVEEIDPQWLFFEEYKLARDDFKDQWEGARITTLTEKVLWLINNIDNYNNFITQAQGDRDVNEKKALYAYNFLRELLHQIPAQNFTQLDHKWLNQVREEAGPYQLIERKIQEGEYTLPSAIHTHLIKQVQELVEMRAKIIPLTYTGHGLATPIYPETYGIALCSNIPDIDEQIAIIYHELGHITMKDSLVQAAIDAGQKTYSQAAQELRSDVNKINHYRDLGKIGFDESTPIGKHIRDTLLKHPTLTFEPVLKGEQKDKMLYLTGREKRADIFAVENLFEQGLLDIILAFLAKFAFGFSTAVLTPEPPYDHPPDMERALYMAGFLISKGLDVNTLFQEWYTKGTCKAPPTDLAILFSQPPQSKGARDFIAAFKLREQKRQDYITWKKKKEKLFKKQGVKKRDNKISSLLKSIYFWLGFPKAADDTVAKEEILFSYNLLRELKQLPIANSTEEINYKWLDEIKKDAD